MKSISNSKTVKTKQLFSLSLYQLRMKRAIQVITDLCKTYLDKMILIFWGFAKGIQV
jgi:hypothetical protein